MQASAKVSPVQRAAADRKEGENITLLPSFKTLSDGIPARRCVDRRNDSTVVGTAADGSRIPRPGASVIGKSKGTEKSSVRPRGWGGFSLGCGVLNVFWKNMPCRGSVRGEFLEEKQNRETYRVRPSRGDVRRIGRPIFEDCE